MKLQQPKKYSREGLAKDAALAVEHFKNSRYEAESEIAKFYDDAFDSAYREIANVLSMTEDLSKLEERAVDLFSEGCLDILRYMERPTLSSDDFKKLSDVGSVSVSKLTVPENAKLSMDYLVRNLNARLFPWMGRDERPSEADLLAAKRSVAALFADQKTKTMMRNLQSRTQEKAVRDALVFEAGFTLVEARDFDRLQEGPKAGQVFDKEASINGVKADIVLGLFDGRVMALECKVSNTAVNSYKRLNHETVDKVVKWDRMFGRLGVVGGCVLQGVFSVDNLVAAQDGGVSIFWSADLGELIDFVLKTKG